MGNILDYLAWRGDLTLGQAPLCPVDTLLLSILPYVRLERFVPATHGGDCISLADAAERYLADPQSDKKHAPLLRAAASAPRFASLQLCGAAKELDKAEGIQFAALTVLLPDDGMFVAFEGTDDTLIGWREDFRMSYDCPVPAQKKAAAYLRQAADAYPKRHILTGGHSKGGNLAAYAAVHCGAAYRRRIEGAYNHDGPGFCGGTLSTPVYAEMRQRIHVFVPQSSIVGFLLEHDDHQRIVKSSAKGLMQHDPYSWQILGADFEYATERTTFGRETEAIIDRLVNDLSPEHRRLFTEALFTALEQTGQSTLSGIADHKLKSLRNVMHSVAELDPPVRAVLQDALAALYRTAKEK